MTQKRVLILSVALLALLAGVAVYFIVTGDSPETEPRTRAEDERPSGDTPAALEADPEEFETSNLQPDPVRDETPRETYEAGPEGARMIIAGRVVDADGAGIADARVTFTGEQALRDLRGHGYTDDVGSYRLLAWAPRPRGTAATDRFGRVSVETQSGGLAASDSVEIPEVPEFEMPDLQVEAGGAIEGTVLTAQGDGVAGAQVTARSSGAVPVVSTRGRGAAASRRQLVKTVFADGSGRFRLDGLPPADYRLTVYGGYAGLETEAVVAPVGAGVTYQDMRVAPRSWIRGTLKDQFGEPVSNAVVRVALEKSDGTSEIVRDSGREGDAPVRFESDAARIRARHQVTDALGRFGFHNLPEGEWNVECRLGESAVSREGVEIETDVELTVEVDTVVGGIVRDAGTGRTIEYYNVRILKGEGETDLSPFQKVSRDGRFQFHPGGQYAFSNPAQGPTRIRVSAPGYAPAVIDAGQIQNGDQRRNLDVELNPLCELTLTLKHDGRALDLEPVALIFDNRLAFAASTDEIGVARIPDVTPAEYRVKVVQAKGRVLEGRLEVPAQSSATLTLELTPGS